MALVYVSLRMRKLELLIILRFYDIVRRLENEKSMGGWMVLRLCCWGDSFAVKNSIKNVWNKRYNTCKDNNKLALIMIKRMTDSSMGKQFNAI